MCCAGFHLGGSSYGSPNKVTEISPSRKSVELTWDMNSQWFSELKTQKSFYIFVQVVMNSIYVFEEAMETRAL